MRTRTARFDAALRLSHRSACRADVLDRGNVIVSGLNITTGRVDYDASAKALARLNITLAEPTRIPGAGGPLSPYGYELAIYRGIDYADGTSPELVPLGKFPIQHSRADGVSLLSTIDALDRSQVISDARFEDDYQIAAGTNYGTAIQTMIAAAAPDTTFAFTTTTHTTPLLTFGAEDDRWDKAQGMAVSIGCRLYFDGIGRCVMIPEPNLGVSTPAWTIDEGATGVLKSVSIDLDRGPAYNRVIAVGLNASNAAVYRAVATDMNPASPTYYLGRFGKKPRFYASPFIASTAQAQAAADGILASGLGLGRTIDLSAVPNPALETIDPVLIKRAALSLNEVQIMDKISIGLGSNDEMTGQGRARQVAA